MKQVYTSIILLLTMLFSAMSIAQEKQKSFINYQGVARKADGSLMSGESLTIGVDLNFGSSSSETMYAESHTLITDANGVFSLLIGNGTTMAGDYNELPWGSAATFATVSINGSVIGTSELMAVPHALSSADNQWHTMGDDIENKNGGNVFVTGSLYASRDLSLAEGAVVNEFSTDITLGDNSDEIVPTQKAIKSYVDSQLGGGGGGADDQTAAEVAYDNSTSGLTATTAQAAIDELITGAAVDADADPTNELQALSFNNATNELSLSDGNAVILPSGGTDADADPNNEIQDISLSGTELTISDGSTIDLAPIVPPGGTDDQNLMLAGDLLSIEDGSGSVDLSTYIDDADADPTNEIDVTAETGILLGDGATVTGLVGTADGQVAKWNAGTSSWEAGTDVTGGGGSSLWTDNGGDIYYNSGKVGVGTNTPESSIAIATDGNQWDLSSTEGDFRIGDATHRLKMGVATAGAGAGDARIRVEGGTDRMMLGGGTNDVLTITDQNVGIGTITPAVKLHVDGNIRSNDLAGVGERNVVADVNGNLIIGAGGGGSSLWTDNGGDIYYNSGKVGVGTNTPESSIAIATDGNQWDLSSTEGDFRIGDATHRLKMGVATAGAGAGDARIRVEGGTDRMMFGGGTNDVLTITDQNVGIGTITPSAKLDVDGNIRSSDLVGVGERPVLADASGNLIIGVGGGGSLLWTENGSDIYYNIGDVGIGTDSPLAHLHISEPAASGTPQLLLEESGSGFSKIRFKNSGKVASWDIEGKGDDGAPGAANSSLKFHFENDQGSADRMVLTGGGNLGIGTANPTERLDVNGNIKTSGEVHGPGTGNANMLAIAYGIIGDSGNINSGSNNFSVAKIGPGKYEITINGENYVLWNYPTVVSRASLGFIRSSSVGGKLIIEAYNTAGVSTDAIFNFVVFKP